MPDTPGAFSKSKPIRLEEKVCKKENIGRRKIETFNDLELDRQQNDVQRQQNRHRRSAQKFRSICSVIDTDTCLHVATIRQWRERCPRKVAASAKREAGERENLPTGLRPQE